MANGAIATIAATKGRNQRGGLLEELSVEMWRNPDGDGYCGSPERECLFATHQSLPVFWRTYLFPDASKAKVLLEFVVKV